MAGKATTIKEALAKWEEKNGMKASEAADVKLIGSYPPIEKMDASLSTLTSCVKLSLSTNSIEKIANLNGLKNLKILSLGRNNIKSLTGLEPVADTLQELWISYNNIDKLKGINVLKKLQVLYISNNQIKSMDEIGKLAELPDLRDLLIVGNPIAADPEDSLYREEVIKRLPKLQKLDGSTVLRPETGE